MSSPTYEHNSDPENGAKSQIAELLRIGGVPVFRQAHFRSDLFLPCFPLLLDIVFLSANASGCQNFFRKKINLLALFSQGPDAVTVEALISKFILR